MEKSSPQYLQYLENCQIQVQEGDKSCTWFSSVKDGQPMTATEELKGTYWRDNMLKTVKFHQALSRAVKEGGPYHLAIEVGPHAALKGPASQTIEELTGNMVPYVGTLSRGKNDVKAFADSLGNIWELFGPSAVNFVEYERLLSGDVPARLLKGLPSYAWNHDRVYWYESRSSRVMRTRSEPVHELLGTQFPDGTQEQIRWHHLLRLEDISWLPGHVLQGQIVFPAAAYIAMALEAGVAGVGDRSIRLLEIQDMTIGRAITFDEDASTREVLFNLSAINVDSKTATFSFSIHSNASREASAMSLNASGRVCLTFGEPSTKTLSTLR